VINTNDALITERYCPQSVLHNIYIYVEQASFKGFMVSNRIVTTKCAALNHVYMSSKSTDD
jgi:hypothetical protein